MSYLKIAVDIINRKLINKGYTLEYAPLYSDPYRGFIFTLHDNMRRSDPVHLETHIEPFYSNNELLDITREIVMKLIYIMEDPLTEYRREIDAQLYRFT